MNYVSTMQSTLLESLRLEWISAFYTWTEIDDNRIKALMDYRRAELYNSSSRSCITYRILRRLEHLVRADEELDLPLKCTCCDGLSLMIDRRINKLLLPALCSNNECKISIIKVNNFKSIKLLTFALIFISGTTTYLFEYYLFWRQKTSDCQWRIKIQSDKFNLNRNNHFNL